MDATRRDALDRPITTGEAGDRDISDADRERLLAFSDRLALPLHCEPCAASGRHPRDGYSCTVARRDPSIHNVPRDRAPRRAASRVQPRQRAYDGPGVGK